MAGHENLMRRCLQLASKGAGHVAPNPMVGALIVHDDRILGEGYHAGFGKPHAEVNCINNVPAHLQHLIKVATLYVSLEPCDHHGKTPPCTDLILKHQIKRIVVACTDTSDKVNGRGIKKLRDAGVEVITGILEHEAWQLNARFFTFQSKKRPYVLLKWAQSADGFVGKTSPRLHISNEYSNRLVHKWRSEEAAILIGTGTAIADNPSLTCRLWPGKNPLRIIIDKKLKVPPESNIFSNEAPTWVFNNLKNEEVGHIFYFKYEGDRLPLDILMHHLYVRGILSVMVEGGSELLQSFIDEHLWDEARVITNQDLYVSDGISAPLLKEACLVDRQIFFSDSITFLRPLNP